MENICRTCLKCTGILLPLFDETELPFKIETISSVQISKTDNLPTKICGECKITIDLCYNLRKVIISSDVELKQRLLTLLDQNDIINDTDDLKFVQINVKPECSDSTEEHNFAEINNHSPQVIKGENSDSDTVTDEVELIEVDIENNIEAEIADAAVNAENNFSYKLKSTFRSRNRLYKCRLCDFTTENYEMYKNHTGNHLTKKSMCNICGKTIRTDNLKKHISIHTEPPVSCKECGKVFKNSESLRSHILIHKGLEITCEFCGQIYKYRGGYRRHLRKKHTLGAYRKVKCHLCNKFFHEQTDLKKHLRSHTGERPFPCQYCKKGFSSTYALKTHLRQHTNERPYTCSFCPMAFLQKVSLRTHLKSKHSVSV